MNTNDKRNEKPKKKNRKLEMIRVYNTYNAVIEIHLCRLYVPMY